MKTVPNWIGMTAAVTVALTLGILVGRGLSPADASSDRHSPSLPQGVPTRSGLAAGNAKDGTGRGSASPTRHDRSTETHRLQLQAILESPGNLDRTQRLLAFLDRLPTDQFATIYAEMANSPMARIRRTERLMMLEAWTERDPLEAVSYLQTHPALDAERETALRAWASMDPESAFQWAQAAEDDGRVNNWVLGAMRGIAATHPDTARDYLLQMESGRTRDKSLEAIQGHIMQFGFDYAEDWIRGLGDVGLNQQASRLLADDLARLDPARAAAWNEGISDPKTQRDVSETVADRWARQDLGDAIHWVQSLPLRTRTEAAEGIARQYARQDPVAAANWLSSLGNDPDYDGARRILIRESYRQDPVTSLDYVSSISDERERKRSYQRYLTDWMRQDADSARSWAERNQSALPPSLLDRVLR